MPEPVADDPILSIASPEALVDPHAAYARLRAERPVFFYPRLHSWMFTRHADCVDVLRDTANFAADWRRVGEEMPPRAVNMLTLDPPEHTAVRRPFMAALREQPAAGLDGMVRHHTEALLTRLAGRPSFDFVADLAEPLSLATICGYLGVPEPDGGWLSGVGRVVGAGMDAGLWPERAAPVQQAQRELGTLVDGWLADPPSRGVLGAVVSHVADSGIDPMVLSNTVRGLLFSGYSSGSKLLSLLAIALFHHKAATLDGFRAADPARAIDEVVRYCSPIHAVARACVHDTRVGDTEVKAGQAVTLLLGAANRDPDRFPEPDRMLLDRHPNPHLGFGRGPKSCLGSPFSVVLIRAVLDLLAERYPDTHAVNAPEYHPNLTLRSPARFETALR
ncbi:cytochrome P450 [Stackebrandtia albiflava]|uniref:Cytochrome P450 n=1 Tax=Stackebrandtia albiflava TaxID=406432 RepID=A0A562VDS2_9ACTN|nr:cytochrome P450 [Stackebrandtia albiflava]TWJ16036.1 cytochrome P450 [Stackebrandtia albiflava]